MSKIYLDHAATTPLRPEARDAMVGMMDEIYGNPSSQHGFGRKAKAVVEECRRSIAKQLNCQPNEIIFTSGGTESDNAALSLPAVDLGYERIITSPIEHHAVLHAAERYAKMHKLELQFLEVNKKGDLDLQQLEDLLKEGKKTVVSLMHGNNEIGNLLDLQQVANLTQEYGALFHSDTVQTIGHQQFDLEQLPIDMLSASAHKFNGPKGVGFMFMRHGTGLGSFMTGGGQERGMRGGTENVVSIAGMHAALEASYANYEADRQRIEKIKSHFIEQVREKLDGVEFNGRCDDLQRSMYTVLSLGFRDLEVDPMMLFGLDLRGIAASGGSACSSGSNQGSHVINALNPGKKFPVLRFSFGLNNTIDEVDQTVTALKEIKEGVVAS